MRWGRLAGCGAPADRPSPLPAVHAQSIRIRPVSRVNSRPDRTLRRTDHRLNRRFRDGPSGAERPIAYHLCAMSSLWADSETDAAKRRHCREMYL